MEHRKKIEIRRKSKKPGFSLIELLLVLAVLSMIAGVVLPSVTIINRKQGIEKFNHDLSIFLQETFHASIFSGKRFGIEIKENQRLVAFFIENFKKNEALSNLLRPLAIPKDVELVWPESGWGTHPEGFCEAIEFFVKSKTSPDVYRFKINPLTARPEKSGS